MMRNPVLDLFTGAALAMGGPMAFMLPQRIFIEMLTAGMGPHHEPAPAEKSSRTAV